MAQSLMMTAPSPMSPTQVAPMEAVSEGKPWIPQASLQASLLSSGAETRHQTLQRFLSERTKGGPHEQVGSKAARLRNTRSCEIYHSGLQEPLSYYKSLEPARPEWPNGFRRYHLGHGIHSGIRVVDQDTVVVSAKDSLQQTKKGLVRSSSGSITYSHNHYTKVELDANTIAQLLAGGVPGGGHNWTPKQVEVAFLSQTGRPGVWKHYEVHIKAFLLSFPKTFEVFGANQEFVRLKHARNTSLLDHPQDAIVRLAKARHHGYVEPWAEVNGPEGPKGRLKQKTVSLPDLHQHRLKTVYRPHKEPEERSEMYAYESFQQRDSQVDTTRDATRLP